MDFRVSVLPDDLGREDRPAPPRQVEPAARHDEARLRRRSRSTTSSGRSTSRGAWCSSPGPTGSGKTTTLYSALCELNKVGAQHQHRRRSGRVQPPRHQPGADARRDRAQLRDEPALVPPAGPGHHHGRRDPRLRDRRNRGQGGAHRPLGALDAPHQRRAGDDLAPPQHGRRAVPHHGEREPRPRPAPRAQDLRRLQAAASRSSPRRCSTSASPTSRSPRAQAHEGRRLQDLQRHRLQGPRRALRGHALHATA